MIPVKKRHRNGKNRNPEVSCRNRQPSLTLTTTSPWMTHGATTLSRTQPSPLPRATTSWTKPSPLPRAMTLRTEPSPRPRATTSRTQLSLRTRGKTSRRQPSPRPRATTSRTQLSPRPRATMSVFGSASSPRRPRFGPCLICFPLRSISPPPPASPRSRRRHPSQGSGKDAHTAYARRCGIILIFIPLLTLSADVIHKFKCANEDYNGAAGEGAVARGGAAARRTKTTTRQNRQLL